MDEGEWLPAKGTMTWGPGLEPQWLSHWTLGHSVSTVGSCAGFYLLSGSSSLFSHPANSVQQFLNQGMALNLHREERIDIVATFPKRLSGFRAYELVLTAYLVSARHLP